MKRHRDRQFLPLGLRQNLPGPHYVLNIAL